MRKLKHELWKDADGSGFTFCLAGPMGDSARNLLELGATLIWTVEAKCKTTSIRVFPKLKF